MLHGCWTWMAYWSSSSFESVTISYLSFKLVLIFRSFLFWNYDWISDFSLGCEFFSYWHVLLRFWFDLFELLDTYLHLGWFRLIFLLALVMNRTFPTMSFNLLADVFLYIFHVQHFKMLLLAWLTAFVFIDWLSLIWIEADVFLVHVWIYFLFDFVIAFSVASEWQQWWHVGFIFEWAWIHTYFL